MAKINRKRFNFLNGVKSKMDYALHSANIIIHGINESRPYALDWDSVLMDYDKIGSHDVAEFSYNYVFGWHVCNKSLSNEVSKQMMYNDIINEITKRRDNVI